MGVLKGLGGLKGVIGIGVAVVVVSGSALAVAGLGDGDGGRSGAETTDKTSLTPEKPPGSAGTGATGPTEPEADPLCVAQAERESALAGVLPVDDAAEAKAVSDAQLAFYRQAAAVVAEPDAAAFRAMVTYQEAVAEYSAARGWEPQSGVQLGADGSLVVPPAVPAEASSVSGILAERCNVEVPTDR